MCSAMRISESVRDPEGVDKIDKERRVIICMRGGKRRANAIVRACNEVLTFDMCARGMPRQCYDKYMYPRLVPPRNILPWARLHSRGVAGTGILAISMGELAGPMGVVRVEGM